MIYAGANRTSLMRSRENKPGSLYELLSRFSALELNLTKLKSAPSRRSDFEFVFFFDLDTPVYYPKLLAMLDEMRRSCAKICIPRKLRRGVNDGDARFTDFGT